MADFNDISLANDALGIKNPSYKNYGKERTIEIEYDLSAVLQVGDKILGPKLPKNCKIKDAKFICPSMGATGIFALGLRDEDGAETLNLIPTADAGGQAVNIRDGILSTDMGAYKENAGNLMIECTEITVAAVGKLQGFVTVVVE